MRYVNRFIRVFAVVMLALLYMQTGLVAQDTLAETFTSEDGSISFDYPSGWDVVEQEPGKVILAGTDVTITFYGPDFVAQVVGEIDTNNLEGTLSGFLDAGGMSHTDVASLEIGGSVVVQTEIESAVGAGVAFGVDFGDGAVGVITAVMSETLSEEFAPTLIDIVASFKPADDGLGATRGALADALEAAAQVQSNVNCTVRIEEERTASVRVGPGTNRSAMLFLPANRDYAVLGQAEANDGAMWWKLDKAEVAPNSGAAELWVDQNQVIASEDCHLVPNVAPPPVIPIVAATDTLPTPGTWYISFSATRITCPGEGTMTFEDASSPEPISVDVLDGGKILLMGGDRFDRTQPGTYVNHGFSPNLGSVTVTVRVITESRMEGEVNATAEGCTLTVNILLTR